METKPKRRWYQFSLRTLLVFVTVASAGFGWLGFKARQAQRQEIAVQAIKRLGGHVRSDYRFYGQINIDDETIGPDPVWLRELFGNQFLVIIESVWLGDRREVTDDALVHLREFTRLKRLGLDETQVSDTGLTHLHGLTTLEELRLSCPHVTDAGLAKLQGLTQLDTLYLDNTSITDAGLDYLQGLTKLQCLHLRRTQITDAGLVTLKALKDLKFLDLSDAHRVTDAGCQELQKALPNLQISRYDSSPK